MELVVRGRSIGSRFSALQRAEIAEMLLSIRSGVARLE